MKISEKITIKHPNPKFPPHPTQRNSMLKEWPKTIKKIYGKKIPKTFEEAEKFMPALEEAEKKLDDKYDMVVVLEEFDLKDLINTYGPLKIGIEGDSLLAFTEVEYQYKEGVIKRNVKKLLRKTKKKLQKKARAKNLKSKG